MPALNAAVKSQMTPLAFMKFCISLGIKRTKNFFTFFVRCDETMHLAKFGHQSSYCNVAIFICRFNWNEGILLRGWTNAVADEAIWPQLCCASVNWNEVKANTRLSAMYECLWNSLLPNCVMCDYIDVLLLYPPSSLQWWSLVDPCCNWCVCYMPGIVIKLSDILFNVSLNAHR